MNDKCHLNRRTLLRNIVTGYCALAFKPINALNTSEGVVYLTADSKNYDHHRTVFNKRFQKHPAIIAVCSTEMGIRYAVIEAKKRSLPIAIKGGGHSFEGFSTNDGGMVIDLSAMKRMRFLSDHQLLCEPGVLLRELYTYTLPTKRLLPAGSCGGVGVAGLALGGGYGLFSRQYGLTCDHLQHLRLIDANGDVHTSDDDQELLWACRGAGNGHFGVVSEMIFSTQKAPAQLFHARIKFALQSVEHTLELTQQWAMVAARLPLEAFSAFVVNGKTLTIALMSSEDVNGDVYASFFNTLKALQPKSVTIKSNPIEKAVSTFYGASAPLYFRNASGGFYDNVKDSADRLEAVFRQAAQTPGTIVQINTFGPVKANEMSVFPQRGFNFLIELQSYWEKPSESQRYMTAIAAMQTTLNEGRVLPHYGNYPDLTIKDWPRAYYGVNNLERLQALKKRIDPENRFQHAQSIK